MLFMKERDSNMELLRIVAMFLVVMVHTNFLSIGEPNKQDLIDSFCSSISRFTVQSISVVCVNLFVLLSGWYGITIKSRKIGSLFFQLAFFVIISLLYGIVFSKNMSITDVLRTIRWHEMWWFVKSYLLLYFMSPVLNAFCDNATKKEFTNVLIAFYAFSSLNWLIGWVPWIVNGYSTISFIGLYLLARYYRLFYEQNNRIKDSLLLIIYVVSTLITIVGMILFTYRGLGTGMWLGYDSPFVILSSLCILLLFSRLSFRSRVINAIAMSSFAVYLFHTSHYVFQDFSEHLSRFYIQHSYTMYFIYSILFGLSIIIISIILDRLRMFFWALLFSSGKRK